MLFDTFASGYHLPPVPISPECVIVDLGANVGYTSVDYAVRYPSARVLAVEMDAANCAMARKNISMLTGRVELIEAAIWKEEGEVAYEGEQEWGFHVVSDSSAPRRARAMSMNTLMSSCGISRIDYLKMDIEGAEAEILTPQADWLKKVDVLQVECHLPATNESVMELLRGFGFVCNVGRRGVLGHR